MLCEGRLVSLQQPLGTAEVQQQISRAGYECWPSLTELQADLSSAAFCRRSLGGVVIGICNSGATDRKRCHANLCKLKINTMAVLHVYRSANV